MSEQGDGGAFGVQLTPTQAADREKMLNRTNRTAELEQEEPALVETEGKQTVEGKWTGEEEADE